jgi:hypothetical protein
VAVGETAPVDADVAPGSRFLQHLQGNTGQQAGGHFTDIDFDDINRNKLIHMRTT